MGNVRSQKIPRAKGKNEARIVRYSLSLTLIRGNGNLKLT